MSGFEMKTLVAVAALALSGSAFAADAAGEQPLPADGANAESTVTRAQVEAQEAANPPAAGQANEQRIGAASGTPQTRAQVEQEVKALAAEDGQFPDASGEQSTPPKPAQ